GGGRRPRSSPRAGTAAPDPRGRRRRRLCRRPVPPARRPLVKTATLDPAAPIETARLTLRPFDMGDLPAIHDLFGREDVCRYLLWDAMDLDQARALLERRV